MIKIFNKFQRSQAHEFIDQLLDNNKKVKIDYVKDKRSISANALYWMWVSCLAMETGNTKDTIHNTLKEMFLLESKSVIFGAERNMYKSTTELDSKEFSDYLNNVQLLAKEYGITLPNPSDKYWNEFYETYKDYV